MAVERGQRALERHRARNRLNQARAVMDGLWAETTAQDATSASRIQAYRLIGLESGLFTERQRIEVAEPMPESESDILAEIENLFQDELGGGGKAEDPGET
jgi:hypothetical protein